MKSRQINIFFPDAKSPAMPKCKNVQECGSHRGTKGGYLLICLRATKINKLWINRTFDSSKKIQQQMENGKEMTLKSVIFITLFS